MRHWKLGWSNQIKFCDGSTRAYIPWQSQIATRLSRTLEKATPVHNAETWQPRKGCKLVVGQAA